MMVTIFISSSIMVQPQNGIVLVSECYVIINEKQALVLQRLASAIPRINLYPVDRAISFPSTYPLYSDLSFC